MGGLRIPPNPFSAESPDKKDMSKSVGLNPLFSSNLSTASRASTLPRDGRSSIGEPRLVCMHEWMMYAVPVCVTCMRIMSW